MSVCMWDEKWKQTWWMAAMFWTAVLNQQSGLVLFWITFSLKKNKVWYDLSLICKLCHSEDTYCGNANNMWASPTLWDYLDIKNEGEEGPLALRCGISPRSQQNMVWDFTAGGVLVELTWYDSSPWADVFINNVFSTLPSSDGRKISLKDAFPLGGIT